MLLGMAGIDTAGLNSGTARASLTGNAIARVYYGFLNGTPSIPNVRGAALDS
jgi:hypothetical protein